MHTKDKKIRKSSIKLLNDDAWLREHFEWLVDNFSGQYVVVAAGEPFIGYDVAELERKAKRKHPGVITTGMPIPRPEDFLSVLWIL